MFGILFRYVFKLPDEYKLSTGWTKYLLRKAMEDILPPKITWRVDKVAYETPQNDWLLGIKNPIKTKRIVDYFNDCKISLDHKDVLGKDNWNYYLTSEFIK